MKPIPNLWGDPRRFHIGTQEHFQFRRHRLTGRWQEREPGATWRDCDAVQAELLNQLLCEPLWVLYLWEFLGTAAGFALALFFGWLILNV